MAAPNRTETHNLSREELRSRFNAVMKLSSSEAPRSVVEVAAAALLLESGLLSRERIVLHYLLADVPEGYVEHAEEALRHIILAASTMVDTEIMMDLLAHEDKLQLFLKRSIAAMDAIHGPPDAAIKNDISLDGAPSYDPKTSLLLKDLLGRLRSAHKAAETAPEEAPPKAKETGGNVPDANIVPEPI
ncbi:hypothetical protein CSIM01_05589 [Colletotrichum simmondsii]|uniref:Uncharacterized protein n=1 Tax=Colletotrichum simmondsii TaxID=703756 RepID=A0A135SRC1_9PEZI|nr:hypothetical protein CSIM01_05589 [Colletotrichum simmondsii]